MRYYLEYTPSGAVAYRLERGGAADTVWQHWPLGDDAATSDTIPERVGATGDTLLTARWTNAHGVERTRTPAGEFDIHLMTTGLLVYIRSSDMIVDSALTVTRWFAPSIGLPVRTMTAFDVPESSPWQRRVKVLAGYSLR